MVDEPSVRSGQKLSSDYFADVTVIRGDFDEPPVFHSGKAPFFPPTLALKRVESGHATISFTVMREGRAVDPAIIDASHPQFAAGIMHVLPSWRFKPARLNAVAVDVRAAFGTRFERERSKFRLR